MATRAGDIDSQPAPAMSSRASTAARVLSCLGCGQIQIAPVIDHGDGFACVTCRESLERGRWRSIAAAAALSIATLAMLIPAATLPLMRTSLLGASREASVAACIDTLFADGWPEVAVAVLLAVVVLPLSRFALLTVTLGTLELGHRPGWLGRAFRYAVELEPWAMTDVFLVGFVIAFLRLRATLAVQIGTGGYCLIAAGILALLARAATDKAAVWRAIRPDAAAAPPGERLVCATCALVVADAEVNRPCPRCQATLRRRERYAVIRASALTLAGALLYLPANLYPIATLPIHARSVHYTVIRGVIDLAQAHLVGLALIVLTASFVIPMLKLAVMAWCVASIARRSDAHLVAKTRAYRFVEEIGRWSMLDPFVIACFAPVATFNGLIYGRAEAGATFFTAVVVLTMIAARRFDPRQLWDAAKGRG